jgi:hypothetical protein
MYNYERGSNNPNYKRYGNYASSYNRSGNQPQKKKSGCRQSQKDDRIVISGWLKRKEGLYSLVAIENKSSDTKSPRWYKMTAKITNKNTMVSQTYPALWDKQKNRMVIQSIGMVANPGKNYFGRGGVPMRINKR